MKKIIPALLFLLCSQVRAEFLTDLHARFPQTKDAVVTKAFGNFYSVVRGNEVLFINDDFSILINGEVVDLKANSSLTASLRNANRPKVNVAELDVRDAIKFGSGDAKLYVFSDPDCPACRKLEPDLEKLTGTTIYLFPFPIASLHPAAVATSEQIWCSKDRPTAWRDYINRRVKPPEQSCANPVARNIIAGNKHRLFGTPALIFEDGSVIPGAVPASVIQTKLDTLRKK